ncbi:MAG: twin-arginine translocation signal domain-containing protein [Pedosphaera sp.]|nr:twin-arginine translocation signal domain-containing protein [Pedosphaera sp.]
MKMTISVGGKISQSSQGQQMNRREFVKRAGATAAVIGSFAVGGVTKGARTRNEGGQARPGRQRRTPPRRSA